MEESNRRTIEGWIDKANNQLQAARKHMETHTQWSDAIEAAQESIELSVKSILSLLQVNYSLTHGWNNEALTQIANQIQKRQLLSKLRAHNVYWATRLPRLLLLANFWAQFYLPAKYGIEAGKLAPPQDLFEEPEAALAIRHAEECSRAASELRYLAEDKLDAISRG
jgi:HEPN domain-containing protein